LWKWFLEKKNRKKRRASSVISLLTTPVTAIIRSLVTENARFGGMEKNGIKKIVLYFLKEKLLTNLLNKLYGKGN
jgi:hypothetical protein